MIVRNVVRRNFHRDSVQLMRLSEEAQTLPGVKQAAVVMGTVTNLEILQRMGLLVEEGRQAAESDMLIAVLGDKAEPLESALREIEAMLLRPPPSERQQFYSIEAAVETLGDANLAIVSVPGEYARNIVAGLLDRGVHVHLFSDHVPLEHEIELKKRARDLGLLVLGPGAGTSIINGRAIGFANVVSRGRIGLVAAAGTGLQEVSVLIHRAGQGISQALGVGGGDVQREVGGIMTLKCAEALESDPATDIVVIVSKLPDPEVYKRVVEYIAAKTQKRYVLCFLGPHEFKMPTSAAGRVIQARTLHAAALAAVRLLDPRRYDEVAKRVSMPLSEVLELGEKLGSALEGRQRYLRGLYSGGTLAHEALVLLGETLGDIYSNTPLTERLRLQDPYRSLKHTVVDLGEEDFTAGRAHPMIDPTVRKLRLADEAKDPGVAVVLLDVMLGHGCHPDPAGSMVDAIVGAREAAAADGRPLPILAHVCGTEQDPQPLSEQERKLRQAGAVVLPTNALMVLAGATIAARGRLGEGVVQRVYDRFLQPEGRGSTA